MQTFELLFIKILPLYILILVGFYATKKLNAEKESVGKLLLYIISPVIIFYGGLLNTFSWHNISLPFVVFLMASITSIVFYQIGRKLFPKGSDANLLAFASGASNTGYFGLPVISAILGQEAFLIAIIANLGMIFYENTIGFYIAAKGNYTARQSFIKILKLPHLYALLIGICFNHFGYSKSQLLLTNYELFKGSYTLLGMMLIGMSLANMKFILTDYLFVASSFVAKFAFLPIMSLLLIYLDQTLQIYSSLTHQVFLIIACTPLAANTVVIANELNLSPGKASLAVLGSTIFALFFIPIIIQMI